MMNGQKVAEKDEYVLPPQDRDDTPEIRPSKIENRNVEDIYDEDHYTLARNSGFGKDFSPKAKKGNVEGAYDEGNYSLARNSGFEKDFSKPNVSDSRVSKNELDPKMPKNTNMIIICIIVVMLGIGAMLACVLITQLGKVIYWYSYFI